MKQILAWLVIALIYGFFFWYGPYYLLTDINGMAAVIAVHVGIAVFLCVVAIGVWAVLCIIEAFER